MEAICPRCGEDTAITIDLTDGDTCHCPECDSEFTADGVRALIAAWGPLLDWIDAHPSRKVRAGA